VLVLRVKYGILGVFTWTRVLEADQDGARTDPQGVGRAGSTGMRQTG
jgi:hypothetical protein